ncbi:MAG: hypothetical protein V3V19_11240 [Cocleimonas sp.]
MKIKELIEKLKSCDPEEEVILAKDNEGNGYSPLSNISHDIYRPESTWSGELVEYERNRKDGDIDVVTLWPVN